jgi:hypothetical protein
MMTAVCVMYSVSPGMDRVYRMSRTAPVFWSTSMPHTRYRNSIPNKDGGAWAGAWASTSLPRLRFLCVRAALDVPYAIAAPRASPTTAISRLGKASGTSAAARENFNTGCDPAMGWTSPLPAVRMRAAMLVSAVVATCRGRLRRGAIREDGCWLHEWRRRQLLNVVNPTLSQRVVPAETPQCTRTQIYNNCVGRCVFGCRFGFCSLRQLSVRGRVGSRTDCCPGACVFEQSMQ